jgi:hypothetical protein
MTVTVEIRFPNRSRNNGAASTRFCRTSSVFALTAEYLAQESEFNIK